MSGPESEWTVFAELSRKHRDVLDLLIEHKTSKEISRILDISPHTVDQRLDSTRSRLGLGNRSELAAAYRRYLEQSGEIYERLTYENFHIGVEAVPLDEGRREVADRDPPVTPPVTPAQQVGTSVATPKDRDGSFPERSGIGFGKLLDRTVFVAVIVLIVVILVAGVDNVLQAARNLLR